MKILKKLFGGRRESRVRSSWNDFRFPGNVLKPGAVGVFASPGVSGIWSAVYLARALQESYSDIPIHFIAHMDYAPLAGYLPWTPELHTYGSDPSKLEPETEQGVLLFASEPGDELLRAVEKISPGACVSLVEHPSVNIQVKIETAPFPVSIGSMMSVLGLSFPEGWLPEPPMVLSEKASAILSPVSHKTLPYILATEDAADILEKKRAEVPLKLVIVDGKSSNIPPETDQALLAAIVAGASAVVTTDRDLWIHSVALKIPVIGLDRRGTFTGWDSQVSRGESQFLEQWASMIRRGW